MESPVALLRSKNCPASGHAEIPPSVGEGVCAAWN